MSKFNLSINNSVEGLKIKNKHKKYSLILTKLKWDKITAIKIKLIIIGKYKK
jgi:hypothetical protein